MWMFKGKCDTNVGGVSDEMATADYVKAVVHAMGNWYRQ
jgi:hypothetical protein